MPLGPVFDVELVTTARRGRYYALRVAYGATLLGFVVARYRQISWEMGLLTMPTAAKMAYFGSGLFQVLNAVQEVAILVLTPALVAGVIADERQRKTLHYLLASELTGAEIVLGKLAARLLHALVFLAAGLPMIALLGLFGGIEPAQVALSFGGATSTAFFLAGLSIFASATSRRVREAVVLAYVLEIAWLALPWVVDDLVSGWEGASRALRPAIAWLTESGPAAMESLGRDLNPAVLARMAWMIGLQVAFGSAFAALAVWRLRKGDRDVPSGGSVEGPGRKPWVTRPIGDDPMMWKECRVARRGGPFRFVLAGLGLMALASLGYLVASMAWPAFEEVATFGYGGGLPTQNHARGELNGLIRIAGAAVSFAWTIAVAVSAACGLTTEREDDTWISLVGTPMEGREILRAKRIGAFLRPRGLILTLLTLWTVGLAAGSIHPLGFAMLLGAFFAVGAFSAALGTSVSLRSRTTAKALAVTLGTILAIDVGSILLAEVADRGSAFLYAAFPPDLFYRACLGYADVGSAPRPLTRFPVRRNPKALDVAACLAATLAHASVAAMLARSAVRSFDRVVDRPRRDVRYPSRLA